MTSKLPWQTFDATFPKVDVPRGHGTQEVWASWSWKWSTAHAWQPVLLKKYPSGQLTER